jgi:Rab-GTPase-TBC domain
MADKDSIVGSEGWDEFEGVELDRYGFIKETKRPNSSRLATPTEMKSALFSPRRGRNVLQKRELHSAGSPLGTMRRPASRKVSARSLNTQHSGLSIASFRSQRSAIRHASNLLPHNRDRRWMDEAGDMLTVSPTLQNVAEVAQVEKISEALKRKEWERSEKWQKMAKNIKKGALGEGMEFDFDTKNPKLIERTWKGIPDRWRTAAWWSFLDTSAKNNPTSRSVDELIQEFHELQLKPSPDDVQIDLDVPRTIGRHIMFRRRYKGGQRLLFRVLHAISIYFPETGYVQGMASLAATLLCYFEEEKCFVMMVRMWELRGLDRLYRHGFEGLMTGLQEFEMFWLNKDVAKKLVRGHRCFGLAFWIEHH